VAVSNIELRVDSRNAVRELNRVNNKTNTLTKSVSKLGVRLAQLEIARRFFKGFREADSASAAVETLGVNSKKLKKELLGVSAEIGGLQSQTQLLAASYDVASAGFNDAASAANILKAASLGATGGLSDLNTVADATTSVLNAYGLSSDKAAKLVDGFIQTQNDGKIVVAQYAQQIGRVAPIAAAAGVGIDELNAAISTVTAQGVPIEATFSGLNQVLASVLKPTAEASKVAKLLGLDFSSAGIKAKGFGGFLEEVVEKTGGSEVALTKLFGSVDALKALFPLVSGDLEVFNKNLENQANSAGAAELAAKTLGGTVTNQIQAIVNDMGTLARQLDETLGPVIKGLLTEVKKITGEFVRFFALIQNAPSALEVFKGNLSSFFGAQSQGIDNLVSAVNMLDASTVKTEAEAEVLEGSINRITSALSNLMGNTTAQQLIDRGVYDEIRTVQTKIADLKKQLRDLRTAGLDTDAQDKSKPKTKSPLQLQIEALLASLSGGGAKQDKTQIQNRAAREQLRITKAQLGIIQEQSAIDKIRLQFAFEKENTEAKYAELLSNALSDEERSNRRAAERNELEIIRLEKNEAITQALQDQFQMYDDLDTSVLTFTGHTQELSDEFKSIANTINNEIINGIQGMIDGTKTLGDVASSMLRRIADQMLEMAIMGQQGSGGIAGTLFSAIGSIFNPAASLAGPGGFSIGSAATPITSGLDFSSAFSGGFASGGQPPVGKTALVGEKGPELFVPKTAGTIVPNHALGGSNIVVNVDASGSSVQGDGQQAKALGNAIGAAVKAEIVKQKMPGGLLN